MVLSTFTLRRISVPAGSGLGPCVEGAYLAKTAHTFQGHFIWILPNQDSDNTLKSAEAVCKNMELFASLIKIKSV